MLNLLHKPNFFSQSSSKTVALTNLLASKRIIPTAHKAAIIWIKRSGIEDIPDSRDLLASNPAKPAANEEDKNHTPIICPLYLLGEYFAVADKPTGLRHNSVSYTHLTLPTKA